MDRDLLEYLMRLGLSEYQAKAMLALYSRNDSTAKDVSEIAKIPYTKIYEILDYLEHRGLVTYTPGKPKVYRPIDASSVIDGLISKQEVLVQKMKDIQKDRLAALEELQEDGETYQTGKAKVRMINSREGVWNLVRQLARNVKKEFLLAANAAVWYESYEDSEAMLAWYDAIVERGVVIKEIFPTSLNINKVLETGVRAGWALQRDWASYMAHPKLTQRVLADELVPTCTAIQDNEEVILGLIVPGVSYSGIIISDKSSVVDTTRYFDMLWGQAEPIKEQLVAAVGEFAKNLGEGKPK